jgi:hypothetical protein
MHSTVEEAEDLASYNEGRIVENRVPSSSTEEGYFVPAVPTAQPSDQLAITRNTRSRLSRPTNPPANLAKRKRSSLRPDPYEIPPDESGPEGADDMGVTIEESSRNPAKRPRKNARAELPPERNGLQDIRTLRSQHGPKRSVSIREPAAADSARGSQMLNADSNRPSGNLKSKRGRPRKKVPKPTSFNENTAVIVLSNERDNNTVPSPELDSRSQAFGEVDTEPSNNLNVDFADLEAFDTMLAKLKHRRHEKKNTNKRSSNNAGNKSEESVLNELLISLTEAYIALRTARIAGRSRAALNAQKKVEVSMQDVIAKANGLNLNSRESLSNVYLDLLPSFINAVRAGTDAHTAKEDISIISLHEIADFLDLIYNLAMRAVEQPTRLQPKAIDGTNSIRQPTIEVLPMIREVRKKFLAELRSRQQAQELAEREKLSAERERRRREMAEASAERERQLEREQLELDANEEKRKQEEEKARSERQIITNKLHRRQRQALDARLADPLWAEWIKSEMATNEAKVEARRRETIPETRTSALARSTSALMAQTYEELDVRASDYERVMVFDKSKKRREQSPRPWPSKAKTIFIDTMRFERGSIALMDCYNRLRTNVT